MSTDRIEKNIILRAPRSRVWRAIADAQEFGAWFGVELGAPIVAGTSVEGRITSPGFEHIKMTIEVQQVEPEHLLSYRWHPYAIQQDVDYSGEPTTLVQFRLEEVPDGTRLTVVESGFDALPLERRDLAFRMDEAGWMQQMKNIECHVTA